MPVAEEAPTDGLFASAKTANPAAPRPAHLRGPVEAQEAYVANRAHRCPPTPRPRRPTCRGRQGQGDAGPAAEVTQFFNRDSSDALQPTADTALTQFIDKPDQIDAILAEWQKNAEKVFKG